jgi:hypothetical protein
VPCGAGVIIENDAGMAVALCDALKAIQSSQSTFVSAMSSAGKDAQWPDIAVRLLRYLKSE